MKKWKSYTHNLCDIYIDGDGSSFKIHTANCEKRIDNKHVKYNNNVIYNLKKLYLKLFDEKKLVNIYFSEIDELQKKCDENSKKINELENKYSENIAIINNLEKEWNYLPAPKTLFHKDEIEKLNNENQIIYEKIKKLINESNINVSKMNQTNCKVKKYNSNLIKKNIRKKIKL